MKLLSTHTTSETCSDLSESSGHDYTRLFCFFTLGSGRPSKGLTVMDHMSPVSVSLLLAFYQQTGVDEYNHSYRSSSACTKARQDTSQAG